MKNMLSKELKQLLELSGGKIIISEGELEKSYLVMRLEDYLREKLEKEPRKEEIPLEEINAQVESLYQANLEEKLSSWEEEELKEKENSDSNGVETIYEKNTN